MNREDYIRALIKSHGYTMKNFAQLIKMPYTTLLSILNGSIGGAAMDNVLKICGALNIRIEDLNNLASQADPLDTVTPETAGIDPQLLKLIKELSPEKQIALKLHLHISRVRLGFPGKAPCRALEHHQLPVALLLWSDSYKVKKNEHNNEWDYHRCDRTCRRHLCIC